MGEIWHDSIQWLQGDEYDSVMNYPFFESAYNFWLDETATARELMYAINRVYSLYPEQVNRVIFNFLDTHDTMRAVTRCGNLDVFYQQLALLMTMPGTVCIYYGTETAIPGDHDPDCRRTMPWTDIESGKFDARIVEMKQLISLRKSYDAIRGTEIHWLFNPEHPRLICYDRPGENRALRVYLNAGNTPVSISGCPLYSRKMMNGQLLSGGILVSMV